MAFVYWSGNYWQANYWQADYWQETANAVTNVTVEPGVQSLTLTAYTPQVSLDLWDYFSDDYFAPNYWQASYWGEANVGGGTGTQIDQSAAGALSLASFQTFAGLDQTIFPPTNTLTVSALSVDAANDVTVTPDSLSLTLTGYSPSTDNAGYVLGDIDFAVTVASQFGFTQTINASAPVLALSPQSPVGVDFDTNVTVNVQQRPSLGLTGFPADVANTVSVLPTTPSLALTEFSATAGRGVLVTAEIESLTLNPRQTNVLGVDADLGFVRVSEARLSFEAFKPSIQAANALPAVPPSTFAIDRIVNATAITDAPNNYLICDRTGFRVKVADGLRKEWDGTMVRRKSFEARHPQDFVRSRPERLDGSRRPEQDDEFITDLYPQGVTAADL